MRVNGWNGRVADRRRPNVCEAGVGVTGLSEIVHAL